MPVGVSIAATAICVGLVVAPVSGLARADPANAGSTTAPRTATESSQTADRGRSDERRARRTESATSIPSLQPDPTLVEDTGPPPDVVEPEADLPDPDEIDAPRRADAPASAVVDDVVAEAESSTLDHRPVRRSSVRPDPSDRPARTTEGSTARVWLPTIQASTSPTPAADEDAPPEAATSAAVGLSQAAAPQPLSPLAQLISLPARLANAVFQFFDLTSSANRPPRPNVLQPINDLLFAAFREFERLLGLHRVPPPQPAAPTLTYTGPTTRLTPTVAQFLNASSAAYVLGSTPGDLVPFTVNGFQLSAVNMFTGMVAKTWVTPERQLIIAFQGTAGGSHLLFNSLIAIGQVLADLQVIFTRTTPMAFHTAVGFAGRVQAAAALQGYTFDDIFVTGHSLGGWKAQYVAQQTGLAGIGFEAPGMSTRVPGNGVDSMFVNVGTYGSPAPFLSTDLPGLQPFIPGYQPGGGRKPHFGPIVMIGDPGAMTPLYNASALWGSGLIGNVIFLIDFALNFLQYHLPSVQAYHLDVVPDPGITPFVGTARGPIHTGYGTLTIPQLMKAASDDGILFRP
ncbi:hypothetical protein KXD98_22920 [Mycobacterium sp. SMC-4]|nr:hypothetical protein [Mycobacterium sp. SMC-4]UXA20970.1 hypothetical protein KXD98_22920 [Mycobacterium sp. SMC-4]